MSLFPSCLDFGGLDVARLVAPGIARVGDDRGDLGVRQLLLANACIAVFGRPFSTMSIGGASGPVTTLEPASAGAFMAGMPLPVAWWQATQFAA